MVSFNTLKIGPYKYCYDENERKPKLECIPIKNRISVVLHLKSWWNKGELRNTICDRFSSSPVADAEGNWKSFAVMDCSLHSSSPHNHQFDAFIASFASMVDEQGIPHININIKSPEDIREISWKCYKYIITTYSIEANSMITSKNIAIQKHNWEISFKCFMLLVFFSSSNLFGSSINCSDYRKSSRNCSDKNHFRLSNPALCLGINWYCSNH